MDARTENRNSLVKHSRLLFVAILLGGVVGFGVADFALARAGYRTLGAVVWGLGFGGTVLVLWYGWLRPLDLGE